MLTLTHLLGDAKCYETVRRLRWPEGTIKCQGYSRVATENWRVVVVKRDE